MEKLTAEQKLLKMLEKADVKPSECEFSWCNKYPYGLCFCCWRNKIQKRIESERIPLAIVCICIGLSIGIIIGFMIGRH